MEFLKLAKARYSCKDYDDSPVDDASLERVLEAGRLAPTAKNNQPQHFYVVRSADALARIDSLTRCRYGAPVVVLVTCDMMNVFHYPGGRYDSGAEDIGIVGAHLTLAAAAEGLDSCWVNLFDPDKVALAFDLPAGELPIMLLDLGHAAKGAGPLPNHTKRKPLDETVTYL